MPSKFAQYKRKVRYYLMQHHNWRGNQCSAYFSNNNEYVKRLFQTHAKPFEVALKIVTDRGRRSENYSNT